MFRDLMQSTAPKPSDLEFLGRWRRGQNHCPG